MAEKCDFIVSNTIEINDALGEVIRNDLHKRQGRYTYLYPSNMKIDLQHGTGILVESYAFMTDKTADAEDYFNG